MTEVRVTVDVGDGKVVARMSGLDGGPVEASMFELMAVSMAPIEAILSRRRLDGAAASEHDRAIDGGISLLYRVQKKILGMMVGGEVTGTEVIDMTQPANRMQ